MLKIVRDRLWCPFLAAITNFRRIGAQHLDIQDLYYDNEGHYGQIKHGFQILVVTKTSNQRRRTRAENFSDSKKVFFVIFRQNQAFWCPACSVKQLVLGQFLSKRPKLPWLSRF